MISRTGILLGLLVLFGLPPALPGHARILPELEANGTEKTAPKAEITADHWMTRAMSRFEEITNFVTSVEVATVDPIGIQKPTSSKESWQFTRLHGTNVFIRTRLTPWRAQERIESEKIVGGSLILSNGTLALPPGLSLPGFETYNFLSEMLSSRPTVETVDSESIAISAVTRPGVSWKAWFGKKGVLPMRIEQKEGSQVTLVYTRTDPEANADVLPLQDAMHLYKNGQIVISILRSFLQTKALPPKLTDSR